VRLYEEDWSGLPYPCMLAMFCATWSVFWRPLEFPGNEFTIPANHGAAALYGDGVAALACCGAISLFSIASCWSGLLELGVGCAGLGVAALGCALATIVGEGVVRPGASGSGEFIAVAMFGADSVGHWPRRAAAILGRLAGSFKSVSRSPPVAFWYSVRARYAAPCS